MASLIDALPVELKENISSFILHSNDYINIYFAHL